MKDKFSEFFGKYFFNAGKSAKHFGEISFNEVAFSKVFGGKTSVAGKPASH
ncbi:MAG: hypothetical protein LBS54_06095 [Dysgonamonadaceae bacterium]|nr:hypothetical protein [Dysgonamonadaceae bacterium]